MAAQRVYQMDERWVTNWKTSLDTQTKQAAFGLVTLRSSANTSVGTSGLHPIVCMVHRQFEDSI
jgi:hypothetical protein